jgi:chromosome segregation ATPase
MEFVNKLLRDGLLLHQQLVDSEDYISLVLARQDSLDEYTVKLENFADAMVKRARDAERCMSTVRRDLVNNLSGNPSATPTEALASTSLQPESAREVVTRSMRKVREQCERTTKMLNDKLSEANADRDAAVVDTTHAVLDAAKLRTQLVDVMAQLERTQKELSAATVKASEAAKAKEELQITVSRLHDTRSQLSEAKLARDTAVAASKHVTSAANTSRAKLGDATSELTRIRTELSDAQGLVSEGAKAKEKLQRMGTALKDIRYQLSEAEAARDNAVATSVRVAADADELRTKLADAKAQLVRTRKELSDAAEKVLEAAKAKEKFQRMATLLKETQRQLSEAESVRNDAVATSNRAVSDADELRANLADAEATVSSMHHRISEVQASRDDAITSSKRAASDADDLRAQLAHLSDIESQLKRTQYQLSDAEAGRDSAVTISTRALSDVDDLRAQLSDAEAQLSKHSKNQEELSETARGLHVCLSDTKARLEATERELIEHVDYASKNAEEAEQAMDSLRMEIRDLQGQTEAEREHRLVKMEDDDTKLTGSATALIPFHTPPSVLAPVEDRREHQLIIIGLEQHLDDVQHRLRWAEGDLKQARDEATRLQLQLDTTHAGYRTVVEDCRLQVEQAREAAREAVEASALAVKELQSKEASRTPASDQVRVKCEECEETREQARVLQGSLTNAKALVIGREREEAPLLRSFEHLPAAILDVARMVARAASNSTSAPSSTSTSPFATR